MGEDGGWGFGDSRGMVLKVYFFGRGEGVEGGVVLGSGGVDGGWIHNCVCSTCILGMVIFVGAKMMGVDGGRRGSAVLCFFVGEQRCGWGSSVRGWRYELGLIQICV